MNREFNSIISNQPMLKILLLWCIGIAFAYNLDNYNIHLTASKSQVVMFGILTFVSVICWVNVPTILKQWVICIGILGFGLLSTFCFISKHHSDYFANDKNSYKAIIAKVTEHPVYKNKMYITKLNVMYDDKNNPKSGKINLMLRTNDTLKYGDVIILDSACISEIKKPLNPHEFSFKNYAKYHNIFHSAFANDTSFVVVDNQSNWIKKAAINTRIYCKNEFAKHVKDTLSEALLMGIVIGDDDGINTETRDLYSATGATHILSVSGLHIGLFVLLLNFFFKLFGKSKKASVLRLFLIGFILCFYGIITGGSPCVMRAVIMAILLLFGRLIFNNISMINIVWTSALMILITNPGALFDVGFQLSYSAVVGLITLYPMLQNAFYIKYKLLRITYETFAVSVAAMLSTLPLIIYYFHSLSILSLLSNFIVVPLSTLILYISMFLLAFSKIFFIGDLLGYLLKLLMILMNNCLLFLQKMDTINLINLTLDIKEIALLYLTFGCFALYIQYRKFQFLLVSLISILCAVFIESLETIYFKNQEKIFVYATQKGKAIDVLIKGDLYSYQEEINDKELRNKIAPNQQNIEYKSHFFINPDSTFHDSKVQYKDKLLVAKNTVISIDKCWQNAAVSVANTSYKFNCNNAILLRGKQKIDTDKRWYSKQKGAYVQSINSN